MENNSWRPAQGEPSMEAPSADWRSQLQPEARQRIVNKIMDTLRRHLPVNVPEGMNELKKIAVRFEEKIYTAALNQSDYLRKISLKMLSMETKTQQPTSINPQSGVNQNSGDTGSLGVPPQINNQGQPLSSIQMANQPPGRQQLLPPNLQNNAPSSIQGSSSLSASSSISGLSQSTLSNFGQTSNMQNTAGISHSSVNNSLAQGTTPDIYANAQRQLQGRQQQQQSILSQQQHQQSQNSLLYQSQLQPQLMKQKMPNNALLQQPMQQQQSLLQANQLQASQQNVMQMSSGLPSGQSFMQQSQTTTMQSAPQSTLQQNQFNSIQQSAPSLLPQQVQAIGRQSQQPQSSMHQQTSSLQQQSAAIHQQSNMQTQQQQLLGQQANMPNLPNMSNIQQNQMLGQQQNNIMDIKQQQRLPVQQSNLVNMQQPQQLLSQQALSLHQQQLGQQANMQGLPQQPQAQPTPSQQQQQLIGLLPNVSNMQSHQRSMQLLQQPKNLSQTQQQLQQPPITLLQSQGQQSHHQSSQQQLMAQFQSQPGQLQQSLTMQQQPNSMQREMQQRIQASGALLQSQSAMEQQKQFMQSQRGLPEVSSSTSIDSTAQTGHTGADWQEEVYLKIQAMKEAHFSELQEFHLKISQKFQQHDMMPHAKQSENYEKLRSFKLLLERMIAFLQISKNNITISLKERLPLYEKQIVGMLSSNRRQKAIPSQQQFQHPGGHAQSTTQNLSSQAVQVQQLENHGNQVQQMNMPGPIASMQPAAASSMQQGSMTLATLAAPVAQQNVMNLGQSVSDLDQVQVNSFGSLQQGSMCSVQQSGLGPLQNSVSIAQQTNLNNLSQSSLNALQSNASSVQNTNVLHQQHLKQQQQEHMIQNQQLKQQLQQRQLPQHMLPQQQRQQLLQSQQPLQQQLLPQQKQQQASQLPVHQMSQLHPVNELNELKQRQGSAIKPGPYQQPHAGGQRLSYYHQQLKTGASFPISSPQNQQASSPQISHHSSPQIDQHTLLPTLTKSGTPMQSTGSPFVIPSPSTPIAPSPMPGDSEKLVSATIQLPSTSQTAHQLAASATSQAQSIAVATPGISASPLLAEFTSQEGCLPNVSTISRTGASERPMERLIKAVQSLSPEALSSAVSDIGCVVSLIDRIAGSAPGNGSRAAVGEDLVAMTKCRLQARNFVSQDGGATAKKMKRHTSAMPLNNISSVGSANDNFMQFSSLYSSELESTATSRVKRQKPEVNHALQEEIREINQQLIDTVASICDVDSDSVAAACEGGEGTVVKFSFSAVAFSPSLKAQFASMHMSPITPLRLLVPANYPKSSPLLLDKLPVETSKEFEDLSGKAKSRFSISLRGLPQPMSLGEMARTWDACVRKVIVQYAQQNGGGSFSSTYGTWENCVGA